MNIIIVTKTSNPLAGAFWKSYFKSSGPLPKAVFLIHGAKESNYSFWQKVLVPFFLFGLKGTFRLGLSQCFKSPLMKLDSKFYRCQSINKRPGLDILKSLKPDIIVSVGAPEIFKKPVLQIPKIAALNIHNGLIPKYRGQFATFWEVYHKEKRGYICIHRMAEQVDAGEIVAFDYLEDISSFKFLDLMLEKKHRGGYLLAKVLKETEKMRMLFKTKIIIEEKDNLKNYFGWPSFKHILNFWKITRTKK